MSRTSPLLTTICGNVFYAFGDRSPALLAQTGWKIRDEWNSTCISGSGSHPVIEFKKEEHSMLRFLGSYAIAKLLGGGLFLAIIIWFILRALS